MNQLQAWSLWKNLIFLSRMTYGRVAAVLRVNIADRHQTACMNRLRAFKGVSSNDWLSSGSVLWKSYCWRAGEGVHSAVTGWAVQLGVNQAVVTVPWQKEMESNFSAWFHKVSNRICWCFNPVKLLAPNFWDFKFIFLVCLGSKCREQHRERIGAAYLPSK
jgi:hypothetical protein